jgi:putative PIN family toxin of toxin-antitoxin system
MRVILDTNIYISYLLSSRQTEHTGVISTIVEAAFRQKYLLLVPEKSIEELMIKLREKKFLTERIAGHEAQAFVHLLQGIAEIVPPIESPLPKVTRDEKDDYLVAYALVYQADYLVSGDGDLLELTQIEEVKMIKPVDFVRLLQQSD